MSVERKLIDDDDYNKISQRARLLGIAADRTRYNHAASMFNQAFSATRLGGDGKALCATDHPYSPGSSSTQSNKGTSVLSHDAVVETRKAMMQFKDSRGNPILVNPDTLLVPVDLMDTAQTIVNSQNRSGTANNDANTLRGYRVVVSRYLTDNNNWFLIDSTMARTYFNWFDRVAPEFAEDANSDFDLASRFRVYMRYSYGFDHWCAIYGHEVSA
jgi:phage major head subunit gpT-like protein